MVVLRPVDWSKNQLVIYVIHNNLWNRSQAAQLFSFLHLFNVLSYGQDSPHKNWKISVIDHSGAAEISYPHEYDNSFLIALVVGNRQVQQIFADDVAIEFVIGNMPVRQFQQHLHKFDWVFERNLEGTSAAGPSSHSPSSFSSGMGSQQNSNRNRQQQQQQGLVQPPPLKRLPQYETSTETSGEGIGNANTLMNKFKNGAPQTSPSYDKTAVLAKIYKDRTISQGDTRFAEISNRARGFKATS